LAALLADSFAQLEQARSAPASVPPDLLAENIAESAALPPPQQERPAPSGLAAFLADGFRQLDAATAPEARPAASPPPDPPPAPVRAEPAVRAADQFPVQVFPGPPPNPSLAAAAEIAGLIGVALVDSESGVLLASLGGGLDPGALATRSTQVMRAEQEAIGRLGLDDRVEDILVTMRRQIHVVRPLRRAPSVFLYLALDRRAANLGMARLKLERIEGGLAT
jgi:predicted regulator of Ras-like GTPase activity (Roadblock/LC7/MglB family)